MPARISTSNLLLLTLHVIQTCRVNITAVLRQHRIPEAKWYLDSGLLIQSHC